MTTAAPLTKPRRKKTRWGDVDGRRRDIVEAARYFVEERGRTDLNMREVARRAGVSPGTLYVYFETKEELFLTAYAARVDEFAAAAAEICRRATTFDDLFTQFADAYLRFYREYGRFFSVWLIAAEPEALENLPAGLTDRLREQVLRVFGLADARVRELATNGGRRIETNPLAMPFVWIVLNGLADHFLGPRAQGFPYAWEDMVRFAARTLRQGLIA